MLDLSTKTHQYFTAPQNYFWRWSEDMEIVEWNDGATIAYRDELTAMLKTVAVTCEPKRLGAVLLVLAACREDLLGSVHGSFFYKVLDVLPKNVGNDARNDYNGLSNIVGGVLLFLSRINALDADLRKEKGRILLLKQLFENDSQLFDTYSLRTLIDEFASGRHDQDIETTQIDLTLGYLEDDLLALYSLSNRYPDTESLEVKIRTGLDNLPTPIELPKLEEVEETDPLSILDELAKDEKTAGLAQLTLSVMAALNVPMHAQGASGLPLGGVSDITNKGDFDRLLLSELAQEDDLLTARLVNNEALYLRREMPPAQPDRERVILLDTTLKMWGMPRPFALSAALALIENKKQTTEVSVFALKGVTFDPLSISSKKGVLDALNHLSPALHCGVALADFMKQAPKTAAIDYVFISDEDAMAHPNFKTLFQQQKPYLRFLIVVNRVGDLQFFEFKQGQTKLISTSKFDLDTLLFTRKKPLKTDNTDKRLRELEDSEMPSFIYHDPTPLYFPPVNLQLDEQNNLYVEGVGVLVITKTQRVLWFKDRQKGAIEVLMFIEEGAYEINYEHHVGFLISVYQKDNKGLKIYAINRFTLAVKVDTFTQTAIPENRGNHYHTAYNRKFVNRGYSILQRLKQIFINPKDCLSFENYYLDVNTSGEIALIDTVNLPMAMRPNQAEKRLFKDDFDVKVLPSNQHIKFYKVTWDCGSVAMLDSRGFLHLKSRNAYIPEITIALVAGKACACWSADGFYSGNPYFIPQTTKLLTGQLFYDKYIRAFIHELPTEAAHGLPF